MAARRNGLDHIRQSLEASVGKRVKLKASRGRRKVVEAEGILEQTYPKVFVIKVNNASNSVQRLSYSYADVLTATVELFIDDEQLGVAGV
ncbi:MAG TPA: hypothetical protein GXX29_13430 [Firmicutes bacterium]|nr:hypothetical protein [Bacillota bacterium]